MFLAEKRGPASNLEARSFSSREVSLITGITMRQLQWWDERGIVSPERKDSRRTYLLPQVLEIMAAAQLRRKGLSLQKIRRVLRLLRPKAAQCLPGNRNGHSKLYLLCDGQGLYLEERPGFILDLLSEAERVMYVVCLSDLLARIQSYGDLHPQTNRQLPLF